MDSQVSSSVAMVNLRANETSASITGPTPLDNHGDNQNLKNSIPANETNSNQQIDLSQNNYSISSLAGSASLNGTTTQYEDFNFDLFGARIYPFKWVGIALPTTLNGWLEHLCSSAMVVGCILPYVPQYVKIYKNQNSSGFSTYICLTLLMANILRVAFWFYKHFETPLLVQSIIMIFLQIALLELCVRVASHQTSEKRTFFSLDLRYFWRWTYLSSYLEFLCLITVLIAIATYFLLGNKPFMEAVGYCALVTEAMLGLPQVIKNYRNKSVQGMSLIMVLLWMCGDTYKTIYFILRDSPFQFWLCGLLQITIDLLILFQVCLFRQNAPIKMSSRADDSPKEMMAL